MKNKIIKSIYIFIAFIQVVLITAVFIIDNLTSKKAGVNHHIYYRRHQFEQNIYSINNLLWQNILAVVLGIIFLIFLIFAIKYRKSLFVKIQLSITVVLSFLLSGIISSQFFIDKLAYPYFIMVFQLILIIQILFIIVMGFVKIY
ncbi:MAG: hypothetical protein ACFWUA_04575 [Sporanaerobacter sp.]|jgi:hypothetical protein|uniref:hypothetical protein n=1 Tax=Sporanaerobacter sp. TaxID=2010183 RepID=UPI003A100FCC